MHELAIAEAIAQIASREAAAGKRVERIELRVGHLRQVVPPALEFGFKLVAEGTVLEGAELAIEEMPVRLRCGRCGEEGEVDLFPLVCASCRSSEVEVLSGEELTVEALVLSGAPAPVEEVSSGG